MRAEILICAVGGQNVKEYLEFFSAFCLEKGYKMQVNTEKGFSKERCSEKYSIHIGGGYGDITTGSADVVLALEQLEGLRFRRYVKDEGAMVISTKRIAPISVLSNVAKYPENTIQKCLNDCFLIYSFDDDFISGCLLTLRCLGVSQQEAKASKVISSFVDNEMIEKIYKSKSVKA